VKLHALKGDRSVPGYACHLKKRVDAWRYNPWKSAEVLILDMIQWLLCGKRG